MIVYNLYGYIYLLAHLLMSNSWNAWCTVMKIFIFCPWLCCCWNLDRSWNPPWSSKVFWIARQILLSFCVNLRESAVAGLFDNCPKLRHRSFSVAIFCWMFHLIWYVRYLILDVYLPKTIQQNARPMFFWLLAIKQLSNFNILQVCWNCRMHVRHDQVSKDVLCSVCWPFVSKNHQNLNDRGADLNVLWL